MTLVKQADDADVAETSRAGIGGVSGSNDQPVLRASEVAHDLANSLTGIRMLVKSLSERSSSQPAVKAHAQSLDRATTHATQLCKQLQSLVGNGDEDFEQDTGPIDLSALVDGMSRMLEVMVQPGARLVSDLASDLPPVVASPTQVRQVLLDLLSNASEGLENEGGRITVGTGVLQRTEEVDRAAVGSLDDSADKCVYLEVADTGCGIDEQELQRIFEPSFTTKTGGHGLGLTSVLKIVQGFGGAIAVDSRVGEGTAVRCLFPCAGQEPVEPKRSEAAEDAAVGTWRSGRTTVLLVEDDPSIRMTTKLLLESSDQGEFDVLACSNGREAMDLFRRRREEISVVVLDLKLPDQSGRSLLLEMRRLAPSVSIIAVSGFAEQQFASELAGEEPEGFLIKPFDADDLIRKVNELAVARFPADTNPSA